MAEVYLDDTSLAALSDTTSGRGLKYPDAYGTEWHLDEYRVKDFLDRTALRILNECRIYKDSGDGDLKCSMYAGAALGVAASNDTITLTDSATNYIYLDADLAVQVSTGGFPAAGSGARPLATIVCAGGVYTVSDITDCRDRWLWRRQAALARLPLDLLGGYGDLALAFGGWGDGSLLLRGREVTGDTLPNEQAWVAALPSGYEAGGTVKLAVHARYAGGGTAGTVTIDAEVYELTDAGAAGGDLCATAAQSVSGSWADVEFTVTPTGLTAGDRLMILLRASVQETGGSDPVYIEIGTAELQADVSE